MLHNYGKPNSMSAYFMAVWHTILEAAPYLLLGLLVSGFVHLFLSLNRIEQHLGKKGFWPNLKATLLGIPLPLCSCAVIPAAVTLKKSGASNGSTSAFLIATPESGIDSISMTYGLLDLPMTVIRPLAAFFSALLAGTAQDHFNSFKLEHSLKEDKHCCAKKTSQRHPLVRALRSSFVDLIDDLALWLAIGLLLAGGISYFVPADFFVGLSGIEGKLLILCIGIPFYICASATTPVAASLILKGMSPGTALILLLVGPATNLSNLVVLKQYLGTRGVLINVFVIGFIAFAASFIVDALYVHFSWPSPAMNFAQQHQHVHASWWTVSLGIGLIVLILKGIWMAEIWPRLVRGR